MRGNEPENTAKLFAGHSLGKTAALFAVLCSRGVKTMFLSFP
jgi:hypothetical protein